MRTGGAYFLKFGCLGCRDCLDAFNLRSAREAVKMNVLPRYQQYPEQVAWSRLTPRRASIVIAAASVRIIALCSQDLENLVASEDLVELIRILLEKRGK